MHAFARFQIALIALTLASCGSCDDPQGDFFAPSSFGTFEFVIEPDIEAPVVIDFGDVEPGARAERELLVQNVGRADLVIDEVRTTSDAFAPYLGALSERPVLAPRETRSLSVEFRAAAHAPVRAELHIDSNDPDEPRYRTILLANQVLPCVGGFTGEPVWQVHPGDGPMCWPDVSDGHGHEAEYQYADVPDWNDRGWTPDPDNHISFEQRSTLCGTDCACRGGGDFTYFQTFLYVPQRARFDSYVVDIRDVDDGARVTVFNAANPAGVTDPASYARIPGGSSADLARYLVAGQNRIVITHIDDCCQISRIRDVVVTVDGAEVARCDAEN